MRVSAEHNSAPAAVVTAVADPSAPDVSFLSRDFAGALQSFFNTVERVTADNRVEADSRTPEFRSQAIRQGRAVGAVIGFFLKFKPDETLEEIRTRGKLFQPPFGPVLVVDGAAVREVLERDRDFTVEPYGVEMQKVMSPQHNGGFNTFVLSTDDPERYEPDKRLLTTVVNRQDAELVTGLIHRDCMRRVGDAVNHARASGTTTIDVVESLARYVPVTVGDRYLGVPVAPEAGTFELSPEMLTYYGTAIDEQPETALSKDDGVIPDERVMYQWIKAAFQHFFNNVQKDRAVQMQGFRACRLLLAYLLREVAVQRQRILAGETVEDTMLSRLVHFQLGRSTASVAPPDRIDPRLVSDLRIAENVMGTVVGAVAGQEEATCRAVDALLRLKDGEYRTTGAGPVRYGSFAEAVQLAHDVLNGRRVEESRAELRKYVFEALRLEPQGEVLLRKCARDGSRIADSRPIAAGTVVFAAHAAAMKDVPEPDAFLLDRPREAYLQYGWSRHTCLGQHVSPVIITESVIALLGLQDLARPAPRPNESPFPLERRFGRLQLDDQNLYATTFSLQFADSGTTRRFWPDKSGD